MSNELFSGEHTQQDYNQRPATARETRGRKQSSPAISLGLVEGGTAPTFKTKQSLAADCYARLDKHRVLNPGQRTTIPLGFCVSCSEGYGLWVLPRSGLAINHGITVLNSPGLVDSDFDDEVCAVLYNSGDQKFAIHPGDRICQIAPTDHGLIKVEKASSSENERTGGFGHTEV